MDKYARETRYNSGLMDKNLMDNLVSIITPCYNAGSNLSHTIESVISQTYQNWEMIIVDDCSSDDSWEIIKKYASIDSRIRPYRLEKPSGSPARPRNVGLENSCGDYVAFLDADDVWLCDKLSSQMEFVASTGSEFVYSDYEKINFDGKRRNRIIKMPDKTTFWDILESCSIPCLTVMIKRDVIGDLRFKNVSKEDYLFWINILKKGTVAYNSGMVLALYREQPKSRSSNKLMMIKDQWNVLRNIEMVKPIVATYFMATYLFKGVFKYLK